MTVFCGSSFLPIIFSLNLNVDHFMIETTIPYIFSPIFWNSCHKLLLSLAVCVCACVHTRASVDSSLAVWMFYQVLLRRFTVPFLLSTILHRWAQDNKWKVIIQCTTWPVYVTFINIQVLLSLCPSISSRWMQCSEDEHYTNNYVRLGL